jgi:hypothetical protein
MPRKHENSLLMQQYREFDQTPGQGARALAEQGKFQEAAEAIERFLARPNINELPMPERCLLWFHAGQSYAMYGDNNKAATCFANANQGNALAGILGPAAKPYLQATVAFLQGNRSLVQQALVEILMIPIRYYPPGSNLVFIPGRVHDMSTYPDATYDAIFHMPTKLPPLNNEKKWYEITGEEMYNLDTNKGKEVADRYQLPTRHQGDRQAKHKIYPAASENPDVDDNPRPSKKLR